MSPALLLIFLCHHINAEYYFKEGNVPSYLYHKFEEIDEEVFPQVISIDMHLTKISGTLLYSIDKNKNQLILTLRQSLEVTLEIEFRKHSTVLSLHELCGCMRCRYERLYIQIKIQADISIQCNNQKPKEIKPKEKKDLNEGFPVPSLFAQTTSSANSADLWIVNHQLFNGLFPNRDQLSGCIFDVKYKNKTISFTTISENVQRKCLQICMNNVCNGGQCYETYNHEPICNCTNTFKNGARCNDDPQRTNIMYKSAYINFEMFKLSWQSSSRLIFIINNTNIGLSLLWSDVYLIFEYNNTHGGSTTRNILSRQYDPQMKHILICKLNENSIEIKIFENQKWSQNVIMTDLNVKKEIFTSLTLVSGSGTIDMVSKASEKEIIWRKINIQQSEYVHLDESKFKTKDPVTVPPTPPSTVALSIVSAILILIIILIIIVVLYTRFKLKRRNYAEQMMRKTDELPMLSLEEYRMINNNPESNSSRYTIDAGDQPWIDRLVAKEKENVSQANFRLAKTISEMAPRGLFDQLRELRGGDSELSNSNISKLIVELEKIKDDNYQTLSLECKEELNQLLEELHDKETENEDKVELEKLIRDLNDLIGFNTGTIRS